MVAVEVRADLGKGGPVKLSGQEHGDLAGACYPSGPPLDLEAITGEIELCAHYPFYVSEGGFIHESASRPA